MAHPFQEHRAHKVEKSRVSDIVGKAHGGEVHSDAAMDAKQIRSMVKPSSLKADGGKSKTRLDKYARGGKVKKGTTVNVIVAPGAGGDKPPMPAMAPPGMASPLPPPRPPMMPPPGGMPPGAGGPPGMMPRRDGGRAGYKTGGAVKSGPTWEEGKKFGTHVSHAPGKNDTDKINTKPALLTRKRGGRAYPLTAGSDSGEGRLQHTKAQKSFKAP